MAKWINLKQPEQFPRTTGPFHPSPLNDGILSGSAESHLQQVTVSAHLQKVFMATVLRGPYPLLQEIRRPREFEGWSAGRSNMVVLALTSLQCWQQLQRGYNCSNPKYWT
jgi:hypothetical protein